MANYRITGPEVSALPGETVVLIDNLRACSSIVTALAMGITRIIPMTDDEKVFKLKEKDILTLGESGGYKIERYDIGNSPVELEAVCRDHAYHTLIIKTSNLVPLLLKFQTAVICSSLNLAAAAEYLADKNIRIVPAGGRYGCGEDLGVAFTLGAKVSRVDFDEEAALCLTRESAAARHLTAIGCAEDVAYIARNSIYDIVPVYDGQQIVRARI